MKFKILERQQQEIKARGGQIDFIHRKPKSLQLSQKTENKMVEETKSRENFKGVKFYDISLNNEPSNVVSNPSSSANNVLNQVTQSGGLKVSLDKANHLMNTLDPNQFNKSSKFTPGGAMYMTANGLTDTNQNSMVIVDQSKL